MKKFGILASFVLVMVLIMLDFGYSSSGGEFELGSTVTCEPTFGFLPCSTDIWGRLFLIVVYNYLMTLGDKYVSDGSDLFFRFIGPGIFGASLFHILGTLPQVSLILVSGLSKSGAGAAREAGMGMSVLAGSAVMSLTLVWASCVAFGSFDLSGSDDSTTLKGKKTPTPSTLTGFGVSTDKETRYTARIMLVSMIPFIILQLPKILHNTTATRVTVLLALIVTLTFFIAYLIYQVFQPWIQNRRFEYVTQKFVKNKLLRLLSSNGKPNVALIREIYRELDKNQDGSVLPDELRVLVLGIQLQADGFVRNDYVGKVMGQFDISGDGQIGEDEFVRVLSKWLIDARSSLPKKDHNPLRFFAKRNQNTDKEQQQQSLIPKKKKSLTAKGTVWQYLQALYLVVLGTAILALLAQPLVMNVAQFAEAANIPGFLIPYFIIPCTLNLKRAMSAINSARQKTPRAASLTLSQIYSGVFMNSMISLTVFLLTLYIRDLTWDVSAEVLVVMLICTSMGIFTSTRTEFPLWTSFIVYLLYPISLLMLYILTSVLGLVLSYQSWKLQKIRIGYAIYALLFVQQIIFFLFLKFRAISWEILALL